MTIRLLPLLAFSAALSASLPAAASSRAPAGATPGARSAPAASFELRPPAGPVELGTPFELEGTAYIPPDAALSIRLDGQETEPFAVLHISTGEPQARGASTAHPVRLRLAAFRWGEETFPALEWTMTGASGSIRTLQSPPVRVDVAAPARLPSEEEDIRDIKPPLAPPRWPFLAAAIAAGLLLAAAAWAHARRRNKSGPRRDPPPDARAPHEIALEELDRLPGLGLPVKEYYARLSDILRAYLEPRFNIPAKVLTTHDLMRMMRQAEIDRSVAARCRELLERCDLVKFAKFVPETRDLEESRLSARDIVSAAMPREPAVPPAPAGRGV